MTALTLLTAPPKFPDENLDYSVDFALRLLPGETVASYAVTVARGSAVVSNVAMVGTKLTFWLAGGLALEDTLLKAKITTNSTPPRTHEILVRVRIISPGA